MEESLNPIKQVVNFLARMNLWLMHLERFGMNKAWRDSIFKMEIRIRTDHFLSMQQEIMNISFQNGKGTERAIQYIQVECNKIRNAIFKFQEDNPPLKEAVGLDQKALQLYCKGLTRTEKKQYDAYTIMSLMFFDFVEDCGQIIELSPILENSISDQFGKEHLHIFTDKQAYHIFEQLHLHFKDNKNLLANYSFVYRIMLKDGKIHSTVRDTIFRQWLSEMKEVDIPKTKTLAVCSTKDKIKIYAQVKELLKQQSVIRDK